MYILLRNSHQCICFSGSGGSSQQNNNYLSVDMYKMKGISNNEFAADIIAGLDDTKLSVVVAHLGAGEQDIALAETSSNSGSLTLYQDITTPSERERKNADIDSELITFLVNHAVCEISRDITLETVLIDYMMRKGILNGVEKSETQVISNWNDIFLSIETIIFDKIKKDTSNNKSILSIAYTNSVRDYVTEYKTELETLEGLEETQSITAEESFTRHEELQNQLERRKAVLQETFTKACNNNDVQALSTNRKVSRSLYFIGTKVCFVWARYNKCMEILAPEQIRKYAKSCENRDSLRSKLEYAQQHHRLLVSPSPEGQMDGSSGQQDASSATITPLGSSNDINPRDAANIDADGEVTSDPFALSVITNMEEKNLGQNLQKIIENIKADKDAMKSFAAVLWAKVPRDQFAMKPRGSKKDKASVSVDPTAVVAQVPLIPPSAASVACMANFLQQRKEVNPYPQETQQTTSTSGDTSTAAVPNNSETSVLLPSVFEVIETYDAAVCLMMKSVYGGTDDMIILASYKKKKHNTHLSTMIQRLLCARFFVSIVNLPADEAMLAFKESGYYDIFVCSIWMRSRMGIDPTTIRGDGYCFIRSIYQCYLRERSGYSMTVDEMTLNDKQKDNAEFCDFVNNFENYIKDDTPRLVATHEVKLFKLRMDTILWRVQLQHKPHTALPIELWGNQADVALIKGNVTSWEITSNTHPVLQRSTFPNVNESAWMQYSSTALDIVVHPGASIDQPTLSAVDELSLAVPNFICFNGSWRAAGNHFFVVPSPSQSEFEQVVAETKKSIMRTINQATALLMEECPNIAELLGIMIDALQNGMGDGAEKFQVVPFDYAKFEKLHAARFNIDTDLGTVDLMDDDIALEVSKEVAALNKQIAVLKAKVVNSWINFICIILNNNLFVDLQEQILLNHNKFMKAILLPAQRQDTKGRQKGNYTSAVLNQELG